MTKCAGNGWFAYYKIVIMHQFHYIGKESYFYPHKADFQNFWQHAMMTWPENDANLGN